MHVAFVPRDNAGTDTRGHYYKWVLATKRGKRPHGPIVAIAIFSRMLKADGNGVRDNGAA